MIARPWHMTSAEIASAEDAVCPLLDATVARLLRPALRGEQLVVVSALERLAWGALPCETLSAQALDILKGAALPGGSLDPKDDDADMPWILAINRAASAPSAASKMARSWYVHGMRLLWDGAQVSTVVQAMAAYGVAVSEDILGREHEVARWMMIAGIETELDDRAGVGLAVALRAARLLSRTPG